MNTNGRLTLAIDPGTTHSGVVLWDAHARRVEWAFAEMENAELRRSFLAAWGGYRTVCEWIQPMGMPVGKEVLDTCRFIGRLQEIADQRNQLFLLIHRSTVKARLCNSARAKDSNVRQALLDLCGECGTKKHPGPLYGVSKHAWQALACAVAVDLE